MNKNLRISIISKDNSSHSDKNMNGATIDGSQATSTKDLSKFKYYSAIKTGFSHMDRASKDIRLLSTDGVSIANSTSDIEPVVDEYIKGPMHVVDDSVFIYPLPLTL